MFRLTGAPAILWLCAFPLAAETSRYTLPPGVREKAAAYSHWQYGLHFLGALWTAAILASILIWRVAPSLRNWVERSTPRRFLQAALFVTALAALVDLARLPLDLAGQWINLRYEQSVESWGAWMADWGKRELAELAIAVTLAWILYGLIRRSPRRWWIYFWLASAPILVFLVFIKPLAIEPLFYQSEPLSLTQPNLVDAMQKAVARGETPMPPERIYLMRASEKLNSLGASVEGLGASKRVVVWDTTLARMTPAQALFVFGHELGHEALGHAPKKFALIAALGLVGLFAASKLLGWALGRWGRQWHIRGVEDWASLPVLVLIAVALNFLAEPLVNCAGRYFEHQADIYGTEVTFGLIPPAAETGAAAFEILGEVNLIEPDPNPLVKLWLFDHPSISERVEWVKRYDPWSQNQTRFVRQ